MEKLNISNLAGGAVVEQFDIELQKVLENIADLNVDAVKARQINVKITFKPSKNRAIASINIQAKSSLVPINPLETNIYIDKDRNGQIVAEEFGNGQVPGQIKMGDQIVVDNATGEILDAKVISINK